MPPRYAPANPLPPYAYVPGHDLPHPVNDPSGHSFSVQSQSPGALNPSPVLALLSTDSASHRRVLAATLAADPRWLSALDLFNGGWYWEAHEAWEGLWHALGRITPEARFVQGLIHLAAAAVKIREGKPAGVSRHTQRARELLGECRETSGGATVVGLTDLPGASQNAAAAALGLAPVSLVAVMEELEAYEPECWHTTRASVVRVLARDLLLAT